MLSMISPVADTPLNAICWFWHSEDMQGTISTGGVSAEDALSELLGNCDASEPAQAERIRAGWFQYNYNNNGTDNA